MDKMKATAIVFTIREEIGDSSPFQRTLISRLYSSGEKNKNGNATIVRNRFNNKFTTIPLLCLLI